MDHQRFDALTRSLARGTSRRRLLKGLLGGLAGGAALGSGGKVFAEDPEEEVLDQATVVTEEPPPDTTVEETPQDPPAEDPPADPPAEEPPQDPPADPPADTPAEEPAPASLIDTAEEGTPTDAAGPALACEEGWTPCETLCCPPGWRCCGIYCIPDIEGSLRRYRVSGMRDLQPGREFASHHAPRSWGCNAASTRNARYGPAPNAVATTPNALTSWTASSARNWDQECNAASTNTSTRSPAPFVAMTAIAIARTARSVTAAIA